MTERLETDIGIIYVPDTDIGQHEWLVLTGRPVEAAFIERTLAVLAERPPGIAIDGGASFGCWTLALARCPQVTRVLAFEPQAVIREQLIRTRDANGYLGKVVIIGCGLAERLSHLGMPVLDLEKRTNFGGVSMGHAYHEYPDARMLDIKVAPLDDFVGPEEHVSFIKLDLEGGEMRALQGAVRTIGRCRPVLFVEMRHTETDQKRLEAFITSLGYAGEDLGPNTLFLPLSEP